MSVPTGANWALEDIEEATRQISGQISAVQLSDAVLDFNINSYYQYDLPRELKIEELYTQYTFTLFPGQQVYTLPGFYGLSAGPFTHVEPNFFVNGQPIFYTQDTNVFYSRTPRNFTIENMGIGNGVQTVFPATLFYQTIFQPITSNVPSSVIVTDQTETLSDNGLGTLISNITSLAAGTVNYVLGQITGATFQTPPAVNTVITVTYNFQQEGPPNTVLFYDRQFTFYPTPDVAYQARIDAYFQPAALVNGGDQPVKPEWGEIIACGAALKILRNFGQMDKYQEVLVYYKRERSKLMSDTDNQLMASRSAQRF